VKPNVKATLVFTLLATVLFHSFAAADPRISGKEAEAIAIAVRIFKSKQGSKFEGHPVYGDLRHYTVELERTKNRLEVTFVPDQPPLKPMRQALAVAPFMAGRLLTFSRSIR